MSDADLRTLAKKVADDLDPGEAELLAAALRRTDKPGDVRAAARDVLRSAFKAPQPVGGDAEPLRKARNELAEGLETLIYKLPDEIISLDALDALADARRNLIKAVCALEGVGHDPVPDQCGKPEHDYCTFCEDRVPGGWTGRNKP